MKSLNIPLGKESSVLFPMLQRHFIQLLFRQALWSSFQHMDKNQDFSFSHFSVKRESVYLSTLSVSSGVLHSLLNSDLIDFSGLMLDLSRAQ